MYCVCVCVCVCIGVVTPGGGSSNEDEYIPGKPTDSEDTMHRNSIIG